MPDDSKLSISLKYYRDLIRSMVAEQPVPRPTALKPFPQPPSVYFDGTNNRVAFENWLYTLLLYFRASMACGEEYDDIRVTTAARYLKGVARDWFFARVAAPGSSIPYKFEEVVIEMAQVFVTLRSSTPPKYISGTTPAAFHFQFEHWFETTIGGSKELRDFYIQNHFLQGMREAMWEMYPLGDKLIRDWFDWFSVAYGDDVIPKEVLLGRTRHVLYDLEGQKNQGG